jgi:DNA-binding transcriptional MerR regulator
VSKPLPDKAFFRIGEAASLVGVKPHVLRYWEGEFRCLQPMKTRGSHRQYRRRDVELARVIRRLLHDEGYTIPGARRRLRELGLTKRSDPKPAPKAEREVALRGALLAVRADLVALLEELEAPEEGEVSGAEEPTATAVVHAVVPSPRRRWRD